LAKTQLGAWEYDIIAPFYKCNMTDIMASIGLVQLKRYPKMLSRRRQIINHYNDALKDLPVQVLNHYPVNNDMTSSSGHLYITRLLNKTMEERNAIIIKMAERDIACNVHYKPLPMMSAYKALGFDIKDYPNAFEMFHNEITLPLHTKLTDEMVDFVIRNYINIVK
jgi:dTDP-4-amino-4,6-dideoxygalactose transaminase